MSINLEEIINRLKAPFPFKEIECKIQATTNDKTKGLAVFYIDSRAIQNRLDEIVGPFNWRNEYMLWQDKAQICGISIYDETRGIWVTKFDGAENTDYEPIKGGLSDSLKRAAVMWGLGRYLYDIDGIWVEVEQKGKGTYIKNSEKQKLQEHYNRFVNNPAASNGDTIKQTPASSESAPQNNKSGAASKSQSQQPQNSVAYDYKVKSAAESGNSTCLKLIGKDGKEYTAYAKKDSPGLTTGACIVNVKMAKKEASFGTYYTLNQYEVAA